MTKIPEEIVLLILAERQRRLIGEEASELKAWINENPGYEKEIRKWQQLIYDGVSAEVYHRIDRNAAWEKVNTQTTRPAGWRKQRRIFHWRSIAAVLLPFAFIGIALFWLGRKDTKEQIINRENGIRSGMAQAELILSGGKKITLRNSQQQKIVNLDGQVIGVDSVNTLIYTAQKLSTEEWNTLRVPRGGEYQLILSDGTKVWLNADSELKFPVQFKGEERRVELKGEAFFEVVKDSAHPFRVETAYSGIRVLGTSFNVSGYEGDEVQQTTLVEGSVEVILPGKVCRLEPGKQLELNLRNQSVAIKEVDVALYSSWKDGIFRFCDMPLNELMVKLQRWYEMDFLFRHDECKKIRFTGAIRKYADFQEFIRLIETTTDVRFGVEGNTVMIQKK